MTEIRGSLDVSKKWAPKPITFSEWLMQMIITGFLDWLCIAIIIAPSFLLLRYMAIRG